MKNCTKCGITKPLFEFSKSVKTKDKLQAYCKSCNNIYYKSNRTKRLDYFRNRTYGLTAEEFKQKIAEQNNACDICGLPFVPHKNPCVDHDHTTSKVRSLLCTHCNSGLGHFKESIRILQSAQDYIKRYSEN